MENALLAQKVSVVPLEIGAALPAAVNSLKMESMGGGTKALADFRGKTLLLVIAAKGSRDAAAKLSSGIGVTLADQTDLVRVVVGDLRAVPGWLRGDIRRGIRNGYQKTESELESAFKAKGLTFEERHRGILLLDWRGELARLLGVAGKTDQTYQAFVIDRQGKLRAHLTQKQEGATEEALRNLVLDALRKTQEEREP